MELKEKLYLNSQQGDKILSVVVDKDMPLGSIFDALMEIKGYIVQRMIDSHQQEQEEAKKQMEPEEDKSDG